MDSCTDNETKTHMSLREDLPAFLRVNKGERFTARELADTLGYSKSWVHTVAQEDDGIVQHDAGQVIAHDIPGIPDPVVLGGNWDDLMEVVKRSSSSKESQARAQPNADQLRKFIRKEIAVDSFPFPNTKNEYSMPE